MNFDKEVDNYKDEIVKETINIIKIPSKPEKSNDIKKPFGENINNALEHMLKLGENLGFKTKNIDGYCGYIEFGHGEELVGIITHLDVVPEGEGWEHSPYEGIIEDGKIYGRGSIDDKGPTIAALYAMKSIKDSLAPSKRIRLILGLDEENTWKCMEHYKKTEESPTIGFSPDADFPCIYAEKGSLNFKISEKNKSEFITRVVGDNPLNVVPKKCEVDVLLNNIEINLKTEGIEAHSAHPEDGVNAVSKMIIKLNTLLDENNKNSSLIKFLYEKIYTQTNGEKLNINFSDHSGVLTLNLAKLALEENRLAAYINIRYPVTTTIKEIMNIIKKSINSDELSIEILKSNEPLCVDKNSFLIQSLLKIYNDYMNVQEVPISIGGSTYAKAFNNVVSFGIEFPGQIEQAHKCDEHIEIDKLILATKIYAKAIYELSL